MQADSSSPLPMYSSSAPFSSSLPFPSSSAPAPPLSSSSSLSGALFNQSISSSGADSHNAPAPYYVAFIVATLLVCVMLTFICMATRKWRRRVTASLEKRVLNPSDALKLVLCRQTEGGAQRYANPSFQVAVFICPRLEPGVVVHRAMADINASGTTLFTLTPEEMEGTILLGVLYVIRCSESTEDATEIARDETQGWMLRRHMRTIPWHRCGPADRSYEVAEFVRGGKLQADARDATDGMKKKKQKEDQASGGGGIEIVSVPDWSDDVSFEVPTTATMPMSTDGAVAKVYTEEQKRQEGDYS